MQQSTLINKEEPLKISSLKKSATLFNNIEYRSLIPITEIKRKIRKTKLD